MSVSHNLFSELRWRGMLNDAMPGTEELLNKEVVRGYVGFDPTADSLHVGHLVQVMLLRHLQAAGHIPVALVGGATGMIGDPSGKSAERNLLDEETLRHNQAALTAQLEKFLGTDGGNKVEIVNNFDWFGPMGFLEFLREIGKYITVSYMMAKDSVQKRLETGISFTEFSYQLVQGFDFYHLWKTHGVKLQMGGSDQWGNIVTGTELIRRKSSGEAFALTSNLITKADGTKFGKSEGGNIWLSPAKTSPFAFYQFWLNTSDTDAAKYIRIFTLLKQEEVEVLETEHLAAPHLRTLQRTLADRVTDWVHGEAERHSAIEASELLFGSGSADGLAKLGAATLEAALEGVPRYDLDISALTDSGINVVDLLATLTSVFPSKGEAKKMIIAGGVSINKRKVAAPEELISTETLLHQRFLLVQKGKKNYSLITFA